MRRLPGAYLHPALVAGFLLALPAMPVSAAGPSADNGAGHYTLAQAFRDALARDARMRAAQSRIVQAEEELKVVKSDLWPMLSVVGNAGYINNRNEARTISTFEGSALGGGLRLSQSIPVFGRLRGRLRGAEAEVGDARYAATEIHQRVLAEVARSFAEQLYQGRLLQRRQDFEMLVDTLKRVADERVALGLADQTELHNILRRLHRSRAERIETGANYRSARARLAGLTGAAQEPLMEASLAGLEVALPLTLEDALERAQQQSPTLARASRRLDVAEGELDFRKADVLPTLSFEINTDESREGDIDTRVVSAGVRLNAPLYAGGGRVSQLRAARAGVETARQELIAEREQIMTEVRLSWDLFKSLQLALLDFDAAVADARTVVELTQSKLDAERATRVEHIDARQLALETEFDQLDTRLRLEIARIDLLQVLAGLGEPTGTQISPHSPP